MTADPFEKCDWFSLDQITGVHGVDEQDPRDRRTQFERDRDRVLHSVAFRRLQGKTQIFASEWADPMRTRLTHTIEVAQIGRAIAQFHGVPGELVEAACLAHDLGHPPFGHVGERVLNDLMVDAGGFDSNAQSFRVVTKLEDKKHAYEGLNLSRAVLLGMLKYPFERTGTWPSATLPPPMTYLQRATEDEWVATSHFVYDDQHDLARWLFQGTPVELLTVARRAERPPRTLPCAIVDWADDIAYSVHDLEDGVITGFLTADQIVKSDALSAVHTGLADAPIVWRAGSPPTQEHIFGELQRLSLQLQQAERVAQRGALRQVTRQYINDFILCTKVEVIGSGETPFDYELLIPEEYRVRTAILKSLTFEYLLKDARITRYMYKGREILRRLFLAFAEDPKIIDRSRDQLFEPRMRALLASMANNEPSRLRMFADYLSGITERQAILLYQTLFESAGGSPLR